MSVSVLIQWSYYAAIVIGLLMFLAGWLTFGRFVIWMMRLRPPRGLTRTEERYWRTQLLGLVLNQPEYAKERRLLRVGVGLGLGSFGWITAVALFVGLLAP